MTHLFAPWRSVWFGQPVALERPVGLLLAALVLALAAFSALRALRGRAAVRAWVTPGREAQLASTGWQRRRSARLALGGLGLALLSLAWAGPKLGERQQKVTRRGIDLVVALDASRSMLAQDVAPSRLTAARAAVEQLFDKLGGDRVGIVAFARDAFVQAPMTTDYGAARLFLRAVDPQQMQQGGTALAAALREAAGLLKRAEHGAHDRAVLVVSDGEDWEGGAVDEARALAADGVHVYTLGVGTLAGAPVPVLDSRGRLVGYQKDAQGNPVLTRPNPAALSDVAAAGKGEAFFHDGTVDVAAVASRIDALQKGELGAGTRAAGIDRFQWFALPGLLLLAWALAIGEERRQRRGRALATATTALLALVIASPAQAAGWLDSPDPDAHAGLAAYQKGDFATAAKEFAKAEARKGSKTVASFDRGVALYKAGQSEDALQAFEQAKSPALQGRDAYDAGLAQAQLKQKEAAIGSFRRALEADPTNLDARHNLEVLLAQQKQEPPKQCQQPKQDQQKQDQQKQDQQKQDQQKQGQQKQDQQKQDQQKQDQQKQDQQKQDQQKQDQQKQDQQKQDQQKQGQQKQYQQKDQQVRAGQAPVQPAKRSDSERALDQLKQNERLLPIGKRTTRPPEEERNEHPW